MPFLCHWVQLHKSSFGNEVHKCHPASELMKERGRETLQPVLHNFFSFKIYYADVKLQDDYFKHANFYISLGVCRCTYMDENIFEQKKKNCTSCITLRVCSHAADLLHLSHSFKVKLVGIQVDAADTIFSCTHFSHNSATLLVLYCAVFFLHAICNVCR